MILAGDVGGTKTLLALARVEGARVDLRFERLYANAPLEEFPPLLGRFLTEARSALGDFDLEGACLGAAGPVQANVAELTNRPWRIDGNALARRFDLPPLRVINDFAAAASGVEALGPADLLTLQDGVPEAHGNRVVLGAGTGLGVAFAIHAAGQWRTLAGEGGHAGFAPESPAQAELVEWVRATEGRVSVEHLLCGRGLLRIHAFLGERAGLAPEGAPTEPAEVTRRALAGDPLAEAALELFLACYGQVAGDLALTVLARGGVFVAGGIAARFAARIAASGFMSAFLAKGPWARTLAQVPVHLVTNERLGLLGAALHAARG